MWQESSPNLAPFHFEGTATNKPIPAVVQAIEAGSIGEELGFEPGDRLVSINGIQPRDLIDYKYLICEERLNLEIIGKNGSFHQLDIEKEPDDSLGLIFTEALFDGLRQCNNKCPFCFIDQQPKGQRRSLYYKDDDYRMSFLYGSYLTLTNLNENDWKRIERQRLSPLFVSVHATDPQLRIKLLQNQKAGLLMKQIQWFADRNLQFHAQIVVCPGINDGKSLTKSLNDLFRFGKGEFPTVISTAIVPVGLTRFRPSNDGLTPVNPDYAKRIIDQVEQLQEQYKKINHSRFAWLSDEWYLIAGKQLPQRTEYEDLPQEENGVGSIRSFLESLELATTKLPKSIASHKTCSWVVGKLVEKALYPVTEKLNKIKGLTLKLYGLPSPYWGQSEVVTGLLTGQDLIEGLKDKELGDTLLIPSVMLKHGESLFLDDMTIDDVSKRLNISISVVYGAEDIVKKAIASKKLFRASN